MSASFKYTLIANFLLIIFPILFALTVFWSVFNEEKILSTHDVEVDDDCAGSMIVNVSFAIFLGAIWNGKKILKVGTL
jgi:hypothetical protein